MENKAGMYHVKSRERVDIFVSFIGSSLCHLFKAERCIFPWLTLASQTLEKVVSNLSAYFNKTFAKCLIHNIHKPCHCYQCYNEC